MRQEDSTFGAEPRHLDRLISLGLQDGDEDVAGPEGPQIEGPGGRVGRYRLLHVLGEGGMGIVYLAEQTELVRRQVALKIIKPGMDSRSVLARFQAEQQALALMEHPHIAHVYDAGLAPSGRPYFVMEHVKGTPITKHCDQQKLTIEQRLHLFLHVCEAIQHAHQKGIIHRDLKPSNILVEIQDQEMIPKIIDFGIARAISQPLTEGTLCTEQGQLIGTPEYMSPEQASATSRDIDTRTDIYSLGVVLYELLAGVLPFESNTLRQGGPDHLRQVIREQDPKTPSTHVSHLTAEECTRIAQSRHVNASELCGKLHGDLDWIVMKCLEKDRTRRYGTAHDLATDLKHYLANEPVAARPWTAGYRLRKAWRRNGRLCAAGGAIVMAMVLALTALLWRSSPQHAVTPTAVDLSAGAAGPRRSPTTLQGDSTENSIPHRNMLANGDLSDGGTGWTMTALPPAEATSSVQNGEYAVSITHGGNAVWDVSLKQEDLPIEYGKAYHVSFDAYADAPRQIIALVGKDAEPWTIYSGQRSFTINTSKQNYSYSFTMHEATDLIARLDFDMGLSTAGVYFDNVSLTEDDQPSGIRR